MNDPFTTPEVQVWDDGYELPRYVSLHYLSFDFDGDPLSSELRSADYFRQPVRWERFDDHRVINAMALVWMIEPNGSVIGTDEHGPIISIGLWDTYDPARSACAGRQIAPVFQCALDAVVLLDHTLVFDLPSWAT